MIPSERRVPTEEAETARQPDLEQEPVNILLVDDHAGNLLALEAILRDESYRLFRATSGREALKSVLDHDFALVLLDVKMPDINGFETASLIRKRDQSKHIPIIFLTAIDVSPAEVMQGYAIGAVDYLVKPIDADILRSKVRGFVELYRKARQQKSDSDRLRRLERERHSNQLLEVRSQRDRFFALSNDMMCLLSPEGVLLETNPAWKRDLGLDETELRGQPLASLFAESDRGEVAAHWRMLREGRGFVTFESQVRRKDGGSRWMSWSLMAFPQEATFYGVAQDVTERIRRERELRRREQELSDFFENASLGVLWMVGDGRIVRANQALLTLLDCPADKVLGRSFEEFGADPAQVGALLERLRKNESVRDAVLLLRRPDGSSREVMVDSNVRWEDGQFVHSRSFVRDLTLQRRAERSLAVKDGVTRVLADSVTIEEAMPGVLRTLLPFLEADRGAVWLVEGRALIRRFSQPAETGPAVEAPAGSVAARAAVEKKAVWSDIDQGGALAFPMMAGTSVAGVLEIRSARCISPDEDIFALAASLGTQLGLFLDRRRAEVALRERSAQVIRHQAALLEVADVDQLPLETSIRTLTELDASILGVERVSYWEFDLDGRKMRCRDLYRRTAHAHDAGAELDVASFPRYLQALMNARIVAAVDAAADPRTNELFDGYLRPLGISSMMDVAVMYEGRVAGVLCHEQVGPPRRWTVEEQEFVSSLADRMSLCLASDDRKRTEGEIRRLNTGLEARVQERTSQLQEALQEQEQFAYSVSHDLRAPLRAMYGFSQALCDDYGPKLDETGREYANRIMSATARLEGLIKDLLTYSRLTRSEIPLGVIHLDAVFARVVKDAEGEHARRGAKVVIDLPMPVVRGHEVTLVQVVTNLLDNAVKFVPPGRAPLVRIRAERLGRRVRIWVEDNGIGIDPIHYERIFRVFERLNRAEEFPGTGIGLAIVRKAMIRMGGDSGVQSDGSCGSRFWIELDAVEAAA